MKNILILIFWGLISHVYCADFYQLRFEGTHQLNSYVVTQTIKITKTAGDWEYLTLNINDFKNYKSFNNTVGITQTVSSPSITITPGATYTKSVVNYGNSEKLNFVVEIDGDVIQSNIVELKIAHTISTSVNLNSPIEFSDPFPYTVNNMPQYLENSSDIPTNNSAIIAVGLEITKRHTHSLSAIEAVGQYMKANITAAQGNNRTGLQTFNEKQGDCDEQAMLMSALLRSVGVPTRIGSGHIVEAPFNMYYDYPFNSLGGFGGVTDGHAWLELYVPNTGWVRCDPAQTTMFFGWANEFKNWEGNYNDLTGYNASTNTWSPSNSNAVFPTLGFSKDVQVSSGTANADYDYLDYSVFQGNVSTGNLLHVANYAELPVPSCINCTPNPDAPAPPTLISANIKTVGTSKYVQLDWSSDQEAVYTVIYRCDGNDTISDADYITKTGEFEYSYDDILDDLEPGIYKYAVASMNHNGESYNSNEILVTIPCYDRLISSKTYSNHALEEGCNIEMEDVSITNNSCLFIDARDEFVINNNFELESGSVLEIK